MGRRETKDEKLLRLMARLTLLNEQAPTTPFELKIWRQQRANILKQLKKHGIETE